MVQVKETTFYKKYYVFGKCLWKKRKPWKHILKYIEKSFRQSQTDMSNMYEKVPVCDSSNMCEKTKFVKISDNKLICDGLYPVEKWGAWIKNTASLYITFDKSGQDDADLHINIVKIDTKDKIRLELIAFVNGQYLSTFSTDKTSDEFVLKIPYAMLVKNNFKMVVSLFAKNQTSPYEAGLNQDKRKLSYGITCISSSNDIVLSPFDSVDSYRVMKYVTSCYQEDWDNYMMMDMDNTKIKKLCNGLSDESVNIIKTLLWRRKHEYQFSCDELYQKHLVYSNDISGYKIINNTGFQPEVFYFKNGLKFLDDKIIKKHLSKGCIIDGGACSGDSALMFAEYDFVDKIYAFEPLSDIYNDMAKTLKVNKCEKAEAVHIGLDAKDGFCNILDEKCKTTTIDTFAKDKKISCIKLDVEGMEFNVIKGAIKTIERDKPLLLICIYHKPKDFFEIKPLIESLNLGYKFKVVDTEPCNQYVGVHAMLIGYIG